MIFPLISILILIISLFLILFSDWKSASKISLISILLSFVLFIPSYTEVNQSFSMLLFSFGNFSIHISIYLGMINLIFAYIILLIGIFVNIYSIEYIDKVSQHKRYFATLTLFEISILLFSISGNLFTMFIGWEYLSLTSYMLIGFYETKEANKSARLVGSVIFISDILFIAGLAIFYLSLSTSNISYIINNFNVKNQAMSVALLLILAASLIKSAQFPFEEWLIHAMQAPTPISAYLHSATLVKAGTFVILLLAPLINAYGFSNVLVYIAIITLFFASISALFNFHIKKITAYSTISEMSLIFLAIGLGNLYAAEFLFIAQAFYKVLLFFIIGILYKANGTEDIRNIYGIKSSKMLYASVLIGIFSATGLVPLSTYYFDVLLDNNISSTILILLLAIEFLTYLYFMRLLNFIKRPSKLDLFNFSKIGKIMKMPTYLFTIFNIILLPILFYYYRNRFVSIQNISYIIDALIGLAFAALAFIIYRNIKYGNEDEDYITTKSINYLYNLFGSLLYDLSIGISIINDFVETYAYSLSSKILYTGERYKFISIEKALIVVFGIFIIVVVSLIY